LDAFIFEVIATCIGQDAANDTETSCVSQENSLVPNGYNVTNGGYNAPKTPEWISSMTGPNNPNYGKPISEEQKKKCQKTISNRVLSDEDRKKLGAANVGNTYSLRRKASDETKKKLSESHMGQKAWNKGIPMSEEAKEKSRSKPRPGWNKGKSIFTKEQIEIAIKMRDEGKSYSEIGLIIGCSRQHITTLILKGKHK
jgi:DNA-binding CsgD family transcriptional regulator